VFSLVFALGCGSSGENGSENTGLSGAGGSSGSAGSPSDAGKSANAGSASAGSPGAGAAGAAGAAGSFESGGLGGASGSGDLLTAADLFPLAVGNRWTFLVTGGMADCAAGLHDATIAGTATQGGEQAFELRDYCRDDFPGYLRASGGEVLEYQAEWARSLAQPLQEGYSWMFTSNYQLEWHFVGTVNVPAGTFDDCWQRSTTVTSGSGFMSRRTYCPGVGPVQTVNSDGEASLASYSLK